VICDEQDVLTLVEIPDNGRIGKVYSRGALIIIAPGGYWASFERLLEQSMEMKSSTKG
jgi:hypothetical protein